jgi:hypothetical protein
MTFYPLVIKMQFVSNLSFNTNTHTEYRSIQHISNGSITFVRGLAVVKADIFQPLISKVLVRFQYVWDLWE